ncbi:hypothetical protein FRB90_010872 [Tulasnella sp. 427]|nr:hypothetical protein FRB90_010872 [Tulasnella sp. 427]
MEIKNAQNTSEIPETQDPAAPKSILKKSEDPIYITSQDLNDPDLAPDDLERLEISSKGKRPLLQPDPVFHIPGKSGWTLRTDSTARRRHIRILGDILYVSIQRQDWYRARRTWALLLRVPEVEWTDIWRVGLFLLDKGVDLDERRARENRIDWLKTMMRKVSYHRETILQELLIELIIAKDFQQAEEQALM